MFHVNIHPFMYKIKMEYAKDMEKRGIGFVNEKFAWKMRKNIQIKMTKVLPKTIEHFLHIWFFYTDKMIEHKITGLLSKR